MDMSKTTKFRITVAVEFSEEGLADYRAAVDISYGDPVRTKKDIREGLQLYALQGLEAHFRVMNINPIDGSLITHTNADTMDSDS
jgi:hypothetical protein